MPYLRSNHFKGTWSEGGAEEVSIMTMGLMGCGRKELNGHIDPRIPTKVADIMGEAMTLTKTQEEADEYASKPPTPPQSSSPTPRVTIADCPVRLQPLSVPRNYGAVERDTIYRSGKPAKENLDFLAALDVNTMLTLIDPSADDKKIDAEVYDFVKAHGIKHENVIITPNKDKDGTRISPDSLCEALLIVLNPMNHPVYIHCNQGRHRTGCIVACLRKIQQWPIEEILTEYNTYAHPKPRKEDLAFIKAFDPSVVYEYAKANQMVGARANSQHPFDSALDICNMASGLPTHEMAQTSTSRSSSSDSDDWLEMARGRHPRRRDADGDVVMEMGEHDAQLDDPQHTTNAIGFR
ncbi:Tyrosine-protein phosphatase DSP3 [Fulvia fulva]|uniref:Tyrosine-protein phosphatase DSP3 n=1 Tax=Passalora fulva TaxID=5499 RepID=A0A9Q8PK91_PASFU|nr:Tyrosine-protein phosphatase DSP3 [Fulvia fulva]KAK4610244.1 Tyrosine-protein phosphatase DSP3 [Fulvia fulva]KAK4610872.1 Tyrosine-protein phosphatase DSP3 [Fulvia fulva]UJO24194.1 Tyrosine-protein phosphatase DSP3 [Fulvia fulva]WPV22326.1 Tyrosine-protein phosphatase DSP3 [Fulvia fulva]WPV36714.1 Tyrosine-protein phosphatase DSP3 [Fulvia fulva]